MLLSPNYLSYLLLSMYVRRYSIVTRGRLSLTLKQKTVMKFNEEPCSVSIHYDIHFLTKTSMHMNIYSTFSFTAD